MLRYEDQLAEIADKDLTVSPSLQTSPLVLAILLLSVLLNMAAAPQLANFISNILSNRDRSGGQGKRSFRHTRSIKTSS